jgi:site-specific recombinase XerC
MEFAKKQSQNPDLTDDNKWLAKRDHAMVELFYSSGLGLSWII